MPSLLSLFLLLLSLNAWGKKEVCAKETLSLMFKINFEKETAKFVRKRIHERPYCLPPEQGNFQLKFSSQGKEVFTRSFFVSPLAFYDYAPKKGQKPQGGARKKKEEIKIVKIPYTKRIYFNQNPTFRLVRQGDNKIFIEGVLTLK